MVITSTTSYIAETGISYGTLEKSGHLKMYRKYELVSVKEVKRREDDMKTLKEVERRKYDLKTLLCMCHIET